MKTFEPKSVEQIEQEFKSIANDLTPMQNMQYKFGKQDGLINVSKIMLSKHYAPLLTAYTTVAAELAKAKQTVADLHRGITEIREMLERTETELAQVRKEREWVSVSKAKPEILDGSESESVLACTKLPTGPKGEHEFFILKEYLKYTKKGWIWRGDGSIVENQITHWMPLPAAPDNLK